MKDAPRDQSTHAMVAAGERCIQNVAKCAEHAIVGMAAPTDVRKMECCLAYAPELRGVVGKERSRPLYKLARMLRVARQPRICGSGELDQRIFGAFIVRQAVEQQTLAKAVRRDDDFLRARCQKQALQHDRAGGQGFESATGNDFQLFQGFARLARQQATQLKSTSARDGILLQDLQRVLPFVHVDARQAAPDAADGKEPRTLQRPSESYLAEP